MKWVGHKGRRGEGVGRSERCRTICTALDTCSPSTICNVAHRFLPCGSSRQARARPRVRRSRAERLSTLEAATRSTTKAPPSVGYRSSKAPGLTMHTSQVGSGPAKRVGVSLFLFFFLNVWGLWLRERTEVLARRTGSTGGSLLMCALVTTTANGECRGGGRQVGQDV